MWGEAGARSTTYAYTRVDSLAGLLDLLAVGLTAVTGRKFRKPAGERGSANTHKLAHRAREYSTMIGLVALSGGPF
jgi:hypothetical protein